MTKRILATFIGTAALLSMPACVSIEDQVAERVARTEQEYRERKERDEAWRKQRAAEMDAEYKATKLQEKAAREDYVSAHPALAPHIIEAILKEQIIRGMSQEDVKVSWGAPERTNRTVGAWGVHEQWVYKSTTYFLYFENGILTSWQESR